MHRGYIKLWRKIQDWELYQDLTAIGFFIHLVLKANHKESFYQGHHIPRGSLVFGRKSAAKDFGLSEMQIRTKLYKLVLYNNITIKTTNRFSIISIVNYENYQSETTNKVTSRQPADNQQTTTFKEYKNYNNEKNKAILLMENPALFMEALKGNPAYKNINMEKELGKMQAWFLLPKNKGRKLSARFILNWLNKVEQPFGGSYESAAARTSLIFNV